MITRFNLYPLNAAPILRAVVRGHGGLADAESLRKTVARHNSGRRPVPGPGFITALPRFCAESDGPEVWVSLDGLRWEVAP